MIIRITVHNKKYTPRLKAFANVLNECDKYYGPNAIVRKEYTPRQQAFAKALGENDPYHISKTAAHSKELIARRQAFDNALNECDKQYDSKPTIISNDVLVTDQNRFYTLNKLVIDNKATDADIGEYVNIIKSKFANYCTDYLFSVIDYQEREYMLNNFEIKVIRAMSQKDENNEVVYIFPKEFGIYAQTVIL